MDFFVFFEIPLKLPRLLPVMAETRQTGDERNRTNPGEFGRNQTNRAKRAKLGETGQNRAKNRHFQAKMGQKRAKPGKTGQKTGKNGQKTGKRNRTLAK